MKKWYLASVCAAVVAAGMFFGGQTAQAEGTVQTEKQTKTQTETQMETQAESQGKTTHSISEEQMEQLIGFIREKLDENGLETREDIEAAIEEGEAEFGIALDEKSRSRVADIAEQVQSLGLDTDVMLDQAQKLYEKYGDQISEEVETMIQEQVVEPVKVAVKQTVTDTVKGFFEDLGSSVQGFLKGFFA